MDKLKRDISEIFSSYLIRIRKGRILSQQQMAEHLRMTPREYSNLERGLTCGSSQSLMLFLDFIGDIEALNFLHEFHDRITDSDCTFELSEQLK